MNPLSEAKKKTIKFVVSLSVTRCTMSCLAVVLVSRIISILSNSLVLYFIFIFIF